MENKIDGLEQLKDQYALLGQTLAEEQIVDEEAIKKGMRKSLSDIKKWYKRIKWISLFGFIAFNLVFAMPLLSDYHTSPLSGPLVLFCNILMLLECFFNYKTHKYLFERDFSCVSMKESQTEMAKYQNWKSRYRKIIYPLCMIMVLWIVYEISYIWIVRIIMALIIVIPTAILEYKCEKDISKGVAGLNQQIQDLKQGE